MDFAVADVEANAISALLSTTLVASPTSIDFGTVNLVVLHHHRHVHAPGDGIAHGLTLGGGHHRRQPADSRIVGHGTVTPRFYPRV